MDRISPDDAGKKGDSCEYATTDSSIDIYRAKKGTPMEGVPVSELPDSSYVADMDTLGVKVSGRIWILMITSDSSRAERKQMMIEIAQKIVAAQT